MTMVALLSGIRESPLLEIVFAVLGLAGAILVVAQIPSVWRGRTGWRGGARRMEDSLRAMRGDAQAERILRAIVPISLGMLLMIIGLVPGLLVDMGIVDRSALFGARGRALDVLLVAAVLCLILGFTTLLIGRPRFLIPPRFRE